MKINSFQLRNYQPVMKISIFHYNFLGFYELWMFEYAPSQSAEFPLKLSGALQQMDSKTQHSELCCGLNSEFGDANFGVAIWKHSSFDHTRKLREEWNEIGKKLP